MHSGMQTPKNTVSEENSLLDRRQAFLRPLHKQTFVPTHLKRFLIILLIEAIIPMVLLRVIYTLFGSIASISVITE